MPSALVGFGPSTQYVGNFLSQKSVFSNRSMPSISQICSSRNEICSADDRTTNGTRKSESAKRCQLQQKKDSSFSTRQESVCTRGIISMWRGFCSPPRESHFSAASPQEYFFHSDVAAGTPSSSKHHSGSRQLAQTARWPCPSHTLCRGMAVAHRS